MADRILATNAGDNNALYLRAHALKLLGRVEEAAEARQVAVIRCFCRKPVLIIHPQHWESASETTRLLDLDTAILTLCNAYLVD